MSQNTRCQSCNGDFDGQDKIPMILPCSHNICAICAFIQFQQNKEIKCFQQNCQLVHKINPVQLKQNTQLLKQLEQKGLLDNIALLGNQQAQIKSALKQLVNQQAIVINKVIQHLISYVFKDSLAVQRELQQTAKFIKQQLNQLKLQQILVQKQQGNQQQIQQLSYNNPQLNQKVQYLINEAQRIVNVNSQVSTQVYQELANTKNQLNSLQQTNVSQVNQINQLSQQVKDLKQEKINFESQINLLVKESQSLSLQFQNLQSKSIQDQQSQSLAYQKQIQDLQKTIDQLKQQYQQPQVIQNKQSSTQPPQPQTMTQDLQITIVSPNSKSVVLQVKPKTTIKQIKEQINQQTKLVMKYLDLLKNNKILKDGQTVVSMGIVDGERIQLRLNKERWNNIEYWEFVGKLYREWGLLN